MKCVTIHWRNWRWRMDTNGTDYPNRFWLGFAAFSFFMCSNNSIELAFLNARAPEIRCSTALFEWDIFATFKTLWDTPNKNITHLLSHDNQASFYTLLLPFSRLAELNLRCSGFVSSIVLLCYPHPLHFCLTVNLTLLCFLFSLFSHHSTFPIDQIGIAILFPAWEKQNGVRSSNLVATEKIAHTD